MTERTNPDPWVRDGWYTETLYDATAETFRIDRVVYRDKTEHQDLVIFDNAVFGRILALDGIIQTTTGDEFVYHEMITHLPILAHGRAREVLVIGGGDGGVARRAMMHPGVSRVTMVEIDRGVVDLSKEWLPEISSGAFDDDRLDLVIADGARFVKETDRRFDVIVIDSTDPIGPGEVLFTQEFYADCRTCLAPGGVFVNQAAVPTLQAEEFLDIQTRLRGAGFADVWAFSASVPTYYGGLMTFGWATDDTALRHVPAEELRHRFEHARLICRYYTPELHAGSFALPQYVLDLMKNG